MKKRRNIKDSYDVVLEYLLSEGHVETVEEANYVMMQMTSEHVQDIVEGKYQQIRLLIKKGTAPKYDPRTGEKYYSEPYQKKW